MLSALILAAAVSIPTNTMVLRTGDRIAIDAPLVVEGDRVTFRTAGALYSIPAGEVDLDASRTEVAPLANPAIARSGPRLRVTPEERDRLLRDLEENHSGTATPMRPVDVLPYPTPEERARTSEDEWNWRNKVRNYEENIQRTHEELGLLQERAERLRSHIAGLLSLGYNPSQFTLDTALLIYTEEQIPRAELEVTRSQRIYDQFRDDARKQGVTPGWLR
jgi:hypothetical protein